MKPKFFRKVLKRPHINVQPTPNFQRRILANGMTILFEKRDLPVVSVAFAVRCGGINESEQEKGISHFVEHMLYKGTISRTHKQIADEIEKNGGDFNGFTDEAITAYWCKMPSNHLDVALNVLSDMIKNPLFDKKELEKERNVIFEEIKMYHDNPRLYIFQQIQEFLYDKPFGLTLIGNTKSLKSLDREKLVKRFKEIYKPNNMILCIVGDADFEKIVKFAEDNFGIEKGSVPKFEIKSKNNIQIEKRKGIDQANLIFSYHTYLSNDKKCYASQILNACMALGMSSRLFTEIREKRNLAYAVKGDSIISKDYAYNLIYVGTTKENVEIVKKLILEEFEKVSKIFTEQELKQLKEQLIGNYRISMEDSQMQMIHLLSYEIDGNAEEFYDFEKNIKSVKIEDVKELAKKAKEKYSFFALVPE